MHTQKLQVVALELCKCKIKKKKKQLLIRIEDFRLAFSEVKSNCKLYRLKPETKTKNRRHNSNLCWQLERD